MVARASKIILLIITFFICGCITANYKLFTDASDPLMEYTLQGTGKGKVLVVHVRGVISDSPEKGMIRSTPSMVMEVLSQLKKAEKDDAVRAILLKVDSPGGTITASDILYHELLSFKKRTGKKIVVSMMNLATSGGYYISLPADIIMAHPTTLTGSVGVIFMRPKVTGLMDKIGIGMEINTSGKNKDMGSPFRITTEEEETLLQDMTDALGERFINLVSSHRQLDAKILEEISTARIYLAKEAKNIGLIDKVGYLSEAITEAKKIAGLPENSSVVVYRRTAYPDDNLYNTSLTQYEGNGLSLFNSGLPESINAFRTGYYYLWLPAAGLD